MLSIFEGSLRGKDDMLRSIILYLSRYFFVQVPAEKVLYVFAAILKGAMNNKHLWAIL